MSDVDLTEPLDAAARAHWASYPQSKFVTYDEIPANVKNTLKTSLLKPVQAAVELAVAAERGRIKAHVEAVGEFDAYLATAPMIRVRAMHARDVRTALEGNL